MTALLAVNLAWTTLCLGGYLPATLVVTGSVTTAALVVCFLSVVFRRASSTRGNLHPASWFFLPFLAYVLANIAWVTPVRWLGWQDGFGWVHMVAVFWIVLNGVRTRAAQRVLLIVLLALGVVAVALACYQRFLRPDWLMLGRTLAAQFRRTRLSAYLTY